MSDFTDRFTNVVAPVISFDNGVEMAEARGAWLTDAAGKRYLDFGTGISVTNCGHNHPRIVAAAHEQLDRVWHGGGTFRYDSYVTAAEQLVSVAPEPIDMFFFMNSGAEAVEAGGETGPAHHRPPGRRGLPGRLPRTNHGLGVVHDLVREIPHRLSPAAAVGVRDALPPSIPERPYRGGGDESGHPRAAGDAAPRRRPDDIACFLIEPVQGEGGYYPAPAAFLQEAARHRRSARHPLDRR